MTDTTKKKGASVATKITTTEAPQSENNTKENFQQMILSRLEGDPEKVIEFASKAAKALTKIVAQKPKKVIIQGEQYLEFEDWQTIGRFYGATVGIEWTKLIQKENIVIGYEARAIVYLHGQIISSAEAECLRDEFNWKNKPQFQLRSMAQTRAGAKALRNVFAWVAVLAGYKPCPAEEMINNEEIVIEEEIEQEPFNKQNEPPISERQLELIGNLMEQKKISISMIKEWVIQKFGKSSAKDLTSKEASEVINALIKKNS